MNNTHSLYFLWASQTGNAECIAKQLHNTSIASPNAFLAAAKVMNLNEFEKLQVLGPHSKSDVPLAVTCVIVCSTCGEGDIPDSGSKFKRWLRNNKDPLHQVRYTVLALGDTNYNNFCAAGKYVDTKLEEKGATRFYARGEADDAMGLDSVVDPWISGLWLALENITSSAPKATFEIAVEPVLPLDCALDTLLLYNHHTVTAQRLGLLMFERILEFGGKVSLHPLSLATWELLQTQKPRILLFVLGGTPAPDAPGRTDLPFISLATNTAASPGALDPFVRWLQASDVVSYAAISVASPTELLSELVTTDAALMRAMSVACAKRSIVDLSKLPVSSDQQSHTTAVPRVTNSLDAMYLWSQVVLDHLPGVIADKKAISSALDRTFHFIRSGHNDHAPSLLLSTAAIEMTSASTPQKVSNRLVHSVLAQLVFLFAGDAHTVASIAHDLHDQGQKMGLDGAITDVANFKSVGFPRRAFFVFVVGPGGGNNIPKSLAKLLKALKSLVGQESPSKSEVEQFQGVKFAILGIDDSSASSQFNAPALELEGALLHLGAKKCHPTGLADNRNEIDLNAILTPWSRTLWSSVAHPMESFSYVDGGVSAGEGEQHPMHGSQVAVPVGEQHWFPWEPVQIRSEQVASTPLLLLYSGPGMAKTLAIQACKEAHDTGFTVSTLSFTKAAHNAAEVSRKHPNIVMFVDCTPQGELASGSKWRKYLSAPSHSPDLFSHAHFAVLGLGSLDTSSYDAVEDYTSLEQHEKGGKLASSKTMAKKHPAYEMASLMSNLQANRVFPVAFVQRLSQLHTIGMPWFRGVIATMTNLAHTYQLYNHGQVSLTPVLKFQSTPLIRPMHSMTLDVSAQIAAPSMLVLYGSVTGNSESIAKDLHREALQRGILSRVSSLNHFERMKFLSTTLVVIVCCTTCSSTGKSGAFPHNARKFVKYIYRKHHPLDLLSTLRYGVLGVGSTKYASTFCAAAKSIDRRLEELGGQRACDIGLADDLEGLDVAVEQWRRQLFEHVAPTLTSSELLAAGGGEMQSKSTDTSPSLRPQLAFTTQVPGITGAMSSVSSETEGCGTNSQRPHHIEMRSQLHRHQEPPFSALGITTTQQGSEQDLTAITSNATPMTKTKVLVMFGSQKGNAENIARTIHHQMLQDDRAEYLEPECCSLNNFDKVHWRKFQVVVVVCSTTGDGEFPDNASTFYRFIRQKSHPQDLLNGIKFTVLGLGDTNYSRFCQAAKTIDRRLEELGATRFYARGDADDAFGLETVVEPWIQNLWSPLSRAIIPLRANLTENALLARQTTVAPVARPVSGDAGDGGRTGSVGIASQPRAPSESSSMVDRILRKSQSSQSVVVGKLRSFRRLLPDDAEHNVVHLNLEVPMSATWSPGDAISILPENDPEEVEKILARLGVSGDDLFLPPTAVGVASLFPGSPIYSRISYPMTNRDVLQHLVSLRIHKANKQIFSVLLLNTVDPAEQSILSSWIPSQQPGSSDRSFMEKLTLLDLLRKFEKATPPFRHVVEYLMVLQPRTYSICSAKSATPTTLSICFKVVPHGVCTNWLWKLCCESSSSQRAVEIPFAFREAAEFRLPQDPLVPLILIGPGTGVAPFLSFLLHRRAIAEQNPAVALARGGGGEVQLFFGCRTRTDYIFKDELGEFVADKTIKTLHVAFSQEPNPGFFWYGGCYVQDKMQECSQYLNELMVHRNAHVYVCGDAESMARDVHRVLIDIIEQHQRCSQQEAAQFINKMAEEGKYQRDIWTSSQ